MNKNISAIVLLAFATFGVQSCLDYDDPLNSLQVNDRAVDNKVYVGNVDVIDYHKQVSKEGFAKAREVLEKDVYPQSKTGQCLLRGGKTESWGLLPSSPHNYQFFYSLGPDAYAGYLTVPHNFGGRLTSSYRIVDGFNGGPLGAYTGAKNAIMPVLHHPMSDSIPEMKAINLLYYCVGAQERADMAGPFTYLEDKKNSQNPKVYNDLKTIYHGIVQNIDTIVTTLKAFDQRPQWYKDGIEELCMTYNETNLDSERGFKGMHSYIALANSLKLRMAMHIVKVEPETARKWAEEAVKSGVIENVNDQHGVFVKKMGGKHALAEIMVNWDDTRLSASMESLLMSLDHPTTHYLWKKNSGEITNSKKEVTPDDSRIVGIRVGTFVGDGKKSSGNQYGRYSSFAYDIMKNAPAYYVKYAEVCFLRAEGALRGWNMGGTAEQFYNEGIRNAYVEDPSLISSSPYKTLVEDYLKKKQPTNYVQKDPMGGEDWPSVTKIGVKWNESDTREVKLEKIITQKYIALFPLSTEAWTELRRTGYPKLFNVLNADDGDGSLQYGDIIRRIPWNASDPISKGNIEATGINALGGEDVQATRLWWDLNTPNF